MCISIFYKRKKRYFMIYQSIERGRYVCFLHGGGRHRIPRGAEM